MVDKEQTYHYSTEYSCQVFEVYRANVWWISANVNADSYWKWIRSIWAIAINDWGWNDETSIDFVLNQIR